MVKKQAKTSIEDELKNSKSPILANYKSGSKEKSLLDFDDEDEEEFKRQTVNLANFPTL